MVSISLIVVGICFSFGASIIIIPHILNAFRPGTTNSMWSGLGAAVVGYKEPPRVDTLAIAQNAAHMAKQEVFQSMSELTNALIGLPGPASKSCVREGRFPN